MTRVIATVGPATRTPAQLTAAVRAGARGFRIPLAWQSAVAVDLSRTIATVAADAGVEVDLYLDVPGPKKILVVPGDAAVGSGDLLSVPVLPRSGPPTTTAADESQSSAGPGVLLPSDVPVAFFEVGDTVLLGDGETAATVEAVEPGRLTLRTSASGLPAGHLGLSVAGKEGHGAGRSPLPAAAAEVIRQIPAATVLLSFVVDVDQIVRARMMIDGRAVWSKIETGPAVANTSAVAAASDGVLLGRGDLLLDVGAVEYFDHEQRARTALRDGTTPVMIGTQLWTASAEMFLPHRSELSCLCGWIADGVDSILLSDETTVGRDPARSIAAVTALVQRYSGTKVTRTPGATPSLGTDGAGEHVLEGSGHEIGVGGGETGKGEPQ